METEEVEPTAWCESCEDGFSERLATLDLPPQWRWDSVTRRNHRVDRSVVVCESCKDDYFQCASCGDWHEHDDGRAAPAYSSDRYCHDCWYETFYTCDECGYEGWSEDSMWDEYGDRQLCPDCHRSGQQDYSDPEPVHRCHKCNTTDQHLLMLTEQYVCDCEAHEQRRKGAPILLAHPLLRVPTEVTDDYGTIVETVRLEAA